MKFSQFINVTKDTIYVKSPQIMLCAGIAGFVGTVVISCRQTLKAQAIIAEAKEQKKLVEACKNKEVATTEEYTEKDAKNDMLKIRVKTGVKLLKNYAPAIIMGGFSIFALFKSHRILSNRNAVLAQAYNSLAYSFEEYKKRAEASENSEDKKESCESKVDKKTKNECKEEDTSRVFDEFSRYWKKHPAYNITFIKGVEREMNDILRARGYLFLNEVYNALGIAPSKIGALVGWTDTKENPHYVDFGIGNISCDQFAKGDNPSILLRFNTEGYILDKFTEAACTRF